MGLARLELGIWLGMLRLGMGLGFRLGMELVGSRMVGLGAVLGVASVLL